MVAGDICSRQTIICLPGDKIQDAVELMHRYNVGALVAVETDSIGNRPVGIITDRDIALKVVRSGLKSEELSVGDLMTSRLVVANEREDIYEVLKKMRSKVVRRIPVTDDKGYLKGILTIEDVLEYISRELCDIMNLFKKEQAR
ncbi:MAG: CBS domain-containing protein [Chitinophagales bacterium]|nr:MAG: CBS domain-containing protein [Chitinophagales bacterium]